MSKVNKRLLLIFAVFCMFILIPCSFASDLNQTDELADNVASDDSIYVSADADDSIADGSADKPYQNITRAIEQFDSASNSNIFVKNGTYVFDNQITIDKNIAILGESTEGVIFDGNNTSGFFSFDALSVSLSGISFVNGYSEGGYSNGVLHTGYNLIIDDCVFKDCNGTAVTISGSYSDFSMPNVQIRNSEFRNVNKSGWGSNGAAISTSNMYYMLNVTNCIFANNYASGIGGAIYAGNARKEPIITNSKFINNSAESGSAIYMSGNTDLTVIGCDFINNTAFDDKSAVIVADASYFSTKTLTVGHNTFANNNPSKEIDAVNFDIIYLDSNVRLSGEDVDMDLGENVMFTVTLSESNGNPIKAKLINITLVDSIFKRPTVFTAITNSEGKAVISLINQSAGTYAVTSSFAGDDKYDAVNASNTIKIKSDHSYNVVFNESIVKVKAGESHFVEGVVTNEYLSWVLPAFTTLNFKWTTHSGGTRYTENYGIYNGRFIMDVLDFDLTTQNEYYYINFTATYENGPVAYGQLIVDTSVTLPPVDESRDVIYVAKDGSDEIGDGSEENPLATPQTAFYVNEVFGGGRTIFIKEGVYDISNYEIYANVTVVGEKGKSIFRQHTGEEGMLWLDNWVTTDFVNITFIDGYRSPMTLMGGSVIVVEYAGSIAHFTGCEFYNNSGSSDGMMYVAYGGIVYIDDCIFVNNSGKTLNPAGAILVLNGYLSVNNSYFEANYGSEGGAIFVAGEDAVAFIENTEFRGNTAYNDSYAISGGGAIYVNNWNVHITNCSFIENYAEINGGAIYILTGKVEIDRCLFENNRVKETGGSKGSAIASDSGYTVMLYVTNSILISDGYSSLVSIVNNAVEQDNEIKLDGNHWGINGKSGVKEYVVIKPTLSADQIVEGDSVEVTVNFALNTGENLEQSVHDYSLNVSASLGSVDRNSITIVDNTAKFNYYATNNGDEVITFSHGKNTYTFKFTVNESEINKNDINANITVDDNKTKILVEVPDDLENNITVILDNAKYSVKANNTLAILPIVVSPGNHEVRVSYDGDSKYKSSISDTFAFSVDRYESNVSISVANIIIGDDIIANIAANANFNENVIVTVNNKNYTVKIINGTGSVKINDLPSGEYTAYVTFAGDDYFTNSSASDDFKVLESPVKVIYVTANGSDTEGNGSQEAPYASISKALDRNNKLGGGRTVIIGEGNYNLSRFAITTDVIIKADGNVVISAAEGKNHLFIGGNVKIALEGLTFINGNGVDAGAIEVGSDEAGNMNKELTITNCSFINNTGAVGAVKTYARTTIVSSTFINNTATGGDGFNQAIISAQDNVLKVSYSIFKDNEYTKEIIVSASPSLANNNFWGTNNKTLDVGENVKISNWIAVVPTIDDDVRIKTNYDLAVEFKQTDDGVNFNVISGEMPDLKVDLTSDIGLINPTTATISNNVATVNYNSSKKGEEVITVYLDGATLCNLTFHIDVPEYDKIYVSPSGNNSANGSMNVPVLTIEYALAQNHENGGGKTIIMLPGEYREYDLVIDDIVTIIGENATINGEGNSIFTVLKDTYMNNLTLTNATCAINHKHGELDIYGFNFTDSRNVIVSSDYLVIENSQFTKNTGIVLNSTSLVGVDGCEFSQNNAENIIYGTNMAVIKDSNFADNEVNEAIHLDHCAADVIGNVFDSNEVALLAIGGAFEINNNNFNGDLIYLKSAVVDLDSNNDTIVNIDDCNINNVIVAFLDGETVIADTGTTQLNATVCDKNGNIINGGKVTFTDNGIALGQVDVINGTAVFNAPFAKGNHTISGSFDSDDGATVIDGFLRIDVDYYWFIGEDKYETLAEAIDAAQWGDVIKGVPGTYIIPKQQIGHRYMDLEPWEVLKSVTITSIAEEPVTLTTENDQMFFVDIGSELALKNIIVANSGKATEDGVIETLYDANLTVINCTFVGNMGENGGAIYAGGNLILKDSVFDSNRAALAGAVEIAFLYYTTGQIIIDNVNFTNNYATFAGAVYCGSSDVVMTNVNFINNTANIGGALFVRQGVTKVTNAQFISNKVVNTETTTISRGGAVHNMLGDLYFENTKFINNSAEGIGGALELENGMYGTASWTTFDDCEFINNSASNGGAMYLGEEYDPYVRIADSVFDSNIAEFDGAAIYDNCGHVTIEKTNFTNNKVDGLDIIHVIGEFISGEGFSPDATYYSELTIEDSSFANNTADYVVFSDAYGIVDIRNTAFDNECMILFSRGDATFIKNTVTNSKDAVIENFGNLSLSGNVFETPIVNHKDILTTSYIVVLDNETKLAAIGDNYILKAVITDDNGNIIDTPGVTLVVDNADVETVYSNSEFCANYTVTSGNHFVTAKCDNEGLKLLKLKTGTLVSKNATEMTFKADNTNVGEKTTITVNVDPQATGNVTVKVNNKTYEIPIRNGVASVDVESLSVGDYDVEISYSGDENFAPAIKTEKLTISKVDDYKFDVNVENKAIDTVAITVELPNDVNGNITVTIDGNDTTVPVKDGKATLTRSRLGVGSHDLNVTFAGNDKYSNSTVSKVFSVSKVDSFIKVAVSDVNVGEDAIINIVVPNDATGNVIITIDKEYLTTVKDGKASYPISGLAAGTYDVEVTYNGDDKYLDSSNSTTFNVMGAVAKASELSIVGVKEGSIVGILKEIDGKPISGENITYVVNGESNTVATDGEGKFAIPMANNGKMDISFVGNENVQASNLTFAFENATLPTVVRAASVIKASDYTTYAIEFYDGERGGYFKIQLVDNNGIPLANKPVKIGFNGVVYDSKTDANGWAQLQINLMYAGLYTFAVAFLGDDDYNGSFVVQKITVNKKKTSIFASAKSFKASAKTKKYTVTLKTDKGSSIDGKTYLKAGKKVTIKINGKTLTAKTNAKGQVTFKLSITKKGRFTGIIKFAGDNTYIASSKTVKITIK